MLESSRLILLPLDVEDITDEYVSWFNDPSTFQFLGTKYGQTKATIRRYVEAIMPPNLLSKIIFKDKKRHVGNIALQSHDPIHRRMELGIVIGVPEMRGKGLGKEACSLMIKYGFDHLNLHKITAGTVYENERMTKVFSDLGFMIEGRLLQHWYLEGRYHDMYRFGLLRENFKPVL